MNNPNTIVANLTAPFTDNLPAGVLIAVPPNAASTCGGVVTATPGGSAVTLTGGAIPAGNGILPGTCAITVNVTGGLPGNYLNRIPIDALQTSNGSNLTPATATLTVLCPPINTAITAPVAVCALSPGNVASVPDTGGAATYNWKIMGGAITSDQTEIGPANNTSTLCVPVEKVPPGPGPNLPPTSQISDQKPGSVLIFPYHTSDASNPNLTISRICLTNVENQWSACVHLFFVDGATCSVRALCQRCITDGGGR